MSKILIVLFVIAGVKCGSSQIQNLKFPPGFLFGAGSSAVQVEGAWNEDGKGENVFDFCIHHFPGFVMDNTTCDVACDSYHLYKHDIPFVKMAGMNTYRFSLSWSRLLPTGDTNDVNQIAIDYYNDLINELLSYNITPVVTITHFDLPLNLSKIGGWANRDSVTNFVAYAEFVLQTFGDRVKNWITINEPNINCVLGYGSKTLPPGLDMPGIADYMCVHHMLLAHAEVYRMYKLMPGNLKDGGKMGFTIGYDCFLPYDEQSLSDHVAADLATETQFGWLLNPVFGSGDYPLILRERVALKSAIEGRKVSRLPKFTPEEIELVKGSADFLGLNHYSCVFTSFFNRCPDRKVSAIGVDLETVACYKPNYFTTVNNFMQVVPGSLKESLKEIREKYNNPLILITENGFPDSAHENLTNNPERELYFQNAISEVFQSMQEGSNLFGYLVWSLLDSFEFHSGYTLKFGIVHVDFEDKNRKRTPKAIAKFFKNFAEYGLNITSN